MQYEADTSLLRARTSLLRGSYNLWESGVPETELFTFYPNMNSSVSGTPVSLRKSTGFGKPCRFPKSLPVVPESLQVQTCRDSGTGCTRLLRARTRLLRAIRGWYEHPRTSLVWLVRASYGLVRASYASYQPRMAPGYPSGYVTYPPGYPYALYH